MSSIGYLEGLDEGKRNNLVTILARIKAVEIANNFPQHPKATKGYAIDSYMQQVVSYKADSFNAGFDWGTPTTFNQEFLHMDVIFRRFCSDLSKLAGVHAHDLRKYLEKEVSHAKQRIAA